MGSSQRRPKQAAPRRGKQKDPNRVHQAAFLAALQCTQETIAGLMSISVATVGRLLDEAREQGVLVDRGPAFALDRNDCAAWAGFGDPFLARAAEGRLERYGVQRVVVFPAAEDDPEETRARLVRVAALIMDRVLAQASALAARRARSPVADPTAPVRIPIGITDGPVMRLAVGAVQRLRHLDGVMLVALSGDPSVLPGKEGDAIAGASANQIVRALGGHLALERAQVRRFPLPLEWPRALVQSSAQLSLLGAIATHDCEVRSILGPGSAPALRSDPALRTAAPVQTDPPLIEEMAALCAELLPPAASAPDGSAGDPDWVAGRVNGHRLPTRASGRAGQSQCELWHPLAPGASPADLRRVADRARPHYIDGCGVVLLASGIDSVDGILALTTARAVNQLVMPSDTTRALLGALGWREGRDEGQGNGNGARPQPRAEPTRRDRRVHVPADGDPGPDRRSFAR